MGRRKGSSNKNGEPVVLLDCDIPYHDCSTVRKVATSNEMHLFDLVSVQTELECIVAGIIERTACLTAELNNTEITPSIRKALCRKEIRSDAEGPQASTSKPSLVVKANPEKPLTLIISQRGRHQQTHTQYPSATSTAVPSVRSKVPPQGSCGRRGRPVETTPSSPLDNAGQSASSYVVPNKFWELMEPYCAEITESNVNHLEELLRSYQDMDSAYFELPPLRPSEVNKQEPLSPAAKRVRRDASSATASPTGRQVADGYHTLPVAKKTSCGNASSGQLAKCIEIELRRPMPDSTPIGRLSQSLLSSCYQENIVFSFTDSCAHLVNTANQAPQPGDCPREPSEDLDDVDQSMQTTTTGDAARVHLHVPGTDEQMCPFPRIPSLSSLVTSRASQPLKNIAKQLHVNSSFRVEKKISQVMDELGLFPLNLVHPPQPSSSRSRTDEPPADGCCSTAITDKTSSLAFVSTDAYYSALLASLDAEGTCTGDVQHNDDVGFDGKHVDEVVAATTPLMRMEVTARRRSGVTSLRSPLRGRRGKVKPLDDLEEGEEHEAILSAGQQPCNSDEETSGDKSRNQSGDPAINGSVSPILTADMVASSRSPTALPERQNCHLKRFKTIKLAGRHRKKMRKADVDSVNSNGFSASPHKASTEAVTEVVSEELSLVNGNVFTDDETSQEGCEIPGDDAAETVDIAHQPPAGQRLSPSARINSSPSLFERVRSRLPPDFGHQPLRHSPHPTTNAADAVGNQSPVLVNGLGDDSLKAATDVDCTTTLGRADDGEQEVGNGGSGSQDCFEDAVSGLRDSDVGTPTRSDPCPVEEAGETQFFPDCSPVNARDFHRSPRQLLSGCASPERLTCPSSNPPAEQEASDIPMDEVSLAILQRQQELRLVCAANHSVLRRLLQAAKRDVQRQEIQRRLAIADADVIEAYNKLESYRPQRKPPLKRDRDAAHKALKERRKILKELEAFDAKSP